jgi:hypothetical protein
VLPGLIDFSFIGEEVENLLQPPKYLAPLCFVELERLLLEFEAVLPEHDSITQPMLRDFVLALDKMMISAREQSDWSLLALSPAEKVEVAFVERCDVHVGMGGADGFHHGN